MVSCLCKCPFGILWIKWNNPVFENKVMEPTEFTSGIIHCPIFLQGHGVEYATAGLGEVPQNRNSPTRGNITNRLLHFQVFHHHPLMEDSGNVQGGLPSAEEDEALNVLMSEKIENTT